MNAHVFKGDIKDLKDEYGQSLYQPVNDLDAERLEKLNKLGWECKESPQEKKESDGQVFHYGVKIRLRPRKDL